jgi:hypothetical protein
MQHAGEGEGDMAGCIRVVGVPSLLCCHWHVILVVLSLGHHGGGCPPAHSPCPCCPLPQHTPCPSPLLSSFPSSSLPSPHCPLLSLFLCIFIPSTLQAVAHGSVGGAGNHGGGDGCHPILLPHRLSVLVFHPCSCHFHGPCPHFHHSCN